MLNKICSKCREEKPATKEYFHAEKTNSDGLRSECKTCRRKYELASATKIKERRRNHRLDNIEEFKKREATYRENNRDYIRARERQYKTNNREKLRLSNLKYWNENKEKFKERREKWRINNTDRIREYYRKYGKKPEQLQRDKFNQHRRRAHKRQLPFSLTYEQWMQRQRDFDFKCAYCGNEYKLEQEHFIALTNGGEYTLNNIIPACKSCNNSKKDKDFFGWYLNYKHYSKVREQKILLILGYKENIQQMALTF